MLSRCIAHGLSWPWSYGSKIYCLITPLTPLRGVCVTRSLVLCVCLVDRCFSFSTFFLLIIVLSVLLRYRDYDYPFGIFKLLQSQVYLCPVENLTELHGYEKFEDPKGVIWSRTLMSIYTCGNLFFNIGILTTPLVYANFLQRDKCISVL